MELIIVEAHKSEQKQNYILSLLWMEEIFEILSSFIFFILFHSL